MWTCTLHDFIYWDLTWTTVTTALASSNLHVTMASLSWKVKIWEPCFVRRYTLLGSDCSSSTILLRLMPSSSIWEMAWSLKRTFNVGPAVIQLGTRTVAGKSAAVVAGCVPVAVPSSAVSWPSGASRALRRGVDVLWVTVRKQWCCSNQSGGPEYLNCAYTIVMLINIYIPYLRSSVGSLTGMMDQFLYPIICFFWSFVSQLNTYVSINGYDILCMDYGSFPGP